MTSYTPYTSFASNSLKLNFPITFPTTGPVTSLIGAVAAVSADPLSGGAAIAASVTIAGNTVTAFWAAGLLAAGIYRIQCEVAVSGELQTVTEVKLRVLGSNS